MPQELDYEVAGLGDDAVDYLAAWDLQRRVHEGVVAGTRPDSVLLLEHPPVFTAGKRTDPHERPADPGGADVIDVDRGGKITFHGPGQLVGYPIVTLPDHVKVVDYVRRVEEALIAVCADFGVTTARVPGRSGVWLRADHRGPERKVAAIGIRVSRGVTMHGFALNCDVDLGWYDRFVPCGIADAGVTSLSTELGRDVTVTDVLPSVRRHLSAYLVLAALHRDPRLRGPPRARARASHRAGPPRGLTPAFVRRRRGGATNAARRWDAPPRAGARPRPGGRMSETVILTRGLRKEFSGRRGTHVAVDDLDLAVPAGGVHGFLGPNGSGKTTTIRMLLGLAAPTSGSMALFGEPVPQRLPEVMDRVGAVVESPKFAPNFTGRQNLRLLAASVGRSTSDVDEALEKVGLGQRSDDRYRAYSLGMKQRLAIAATLLKKPLLLILDEPTNGLDPAGIREIRDLVKDLGASGVTVLLSSHILAEVQQVCDSVTIIGNGRLLAVRTGAGPDGHHAAPTASSSTVRTTPPGRWRRPA